MDSVSLYELKTFSSDTEKGIDFAENNILYIFPYNNPWCWMNKQAIQMTDEIIDVLFEMYDLPENTPIVSTGGSMGGMSAIVYCKYAKRTPIACVAGCPVCDVPFHFDERDDLPRTMYSAFYNEEGELYDILERFSPLHLVPELPRIPYHVFHCDADTMVKIDLHSDKFVKKMRENNHSITYDIVHGKGHSVYGEEDLKKMRQYTLDAFDEFYK